MQQQINDPGVGVSYKGKFQRIINKDGSFNVQRHGHKFSIRDSFQYLVTLGWGKFLMLIFFVFIVLNCAFALLYLLVGVEQINGYNPAISHWWNAFFFSVQTLTTIGYGRLSPSGLYMNLAVSFEAIIGLLSFALATGLMYARFSRPTTRLKFSDNIIVAPYQGGKGLMFRMANERSNILMDAEIKVTLTFTNHKGENRQRSFYQLPLERSKITFFPLSWTVVHPINEESPLYNLSIEEIRAMETEVLISFRAFDNTYSETIYTTYSYMFSEFQMGKSFKPAFKIEENGKTILDLNLISDLDKVDF